MRQEEGGAGIDVPKAKVSCRSGLVSGGAWVATARGVGCNHGTETRSTWHRSWYNDTGWWLQCLFFSGGRIMEKRMR